MGSWTLYSSTILTCWPAVWIHARAKRGDIGTAGPDRLTYKQKLKQNPVVQLMLMRGSQVDEQDSRTMQSG